MEELIKKYIVVKEIANDEISIGLREDFKECAICGSYDKYGAIIGCTTAGCHSLDNSKSNCQFDLISAIQDRFWPHYIGERSLWDYIGDFEGSMGTIGELRDTLTAMNDEYFDATETGDSKNLYVQLPVDDVIIFAERWLEDNEVHMEHEAFTYHDGRNFRTLVLFNQYSDADEDLDELSKEESIKILSQYDTAEWQYPYRDTQSAVTDNFKFTRTVFASDPWVAHVEELG